MNKALFFILVSGFLSGYCSGGYSEYDLSYADVGKSKRGRERSGDGSSEKVCKSSIASYIVNGKKYYAAYVPFSQLTDDCKVYIKDKLVHGSEFKGYYCYDAYDKGLFKISHKGERICPWFNGIFRSAAMESGSLMEQKYGVIPNIQID